MKYMENFMRYYIGFYTRQPQIIRDQIGGAQLLAVIEASRSLYPFTDRLDAILRWYDSISWPLSYVNHRVRLGSGKGQEIDLLGAMGGDMWVCQSKWVTSQKIDPAVLRELMAQAEAVWAEYDPISVRMWLFAPEGLTQEALALAQQEGVLWSTRAQLDDLLTYLGLRKLPTL